MGSGRAFVAGRDAARRAFLNTVGKDGSQETIYPFAVESAAHTFPAIKHAVLVAHQGRRILALELYTPQGATWLAQLQATLTWANLDEIRILPQMPVDKRHNAKINYPALTCAC